MPSPKAARVEELKAAIAALEQRPLLHADSVSLAPRTGNRNGIEALLAAPGGLLQEIFLDEQRSTGTGLGFALGLTRTLFTPARRAILYLQLAAETQEIGLPYAPGFAPLGIDPETLVLCRVETTVELLWAMEEAIGCRAVASVIADISLGDKDVDFTVSRRLSMRTASTGASAFLIRYGTGREASAARLRWHVMPAVSGGHRYDASAPGPPRFAVTLEKSRLGAKAQRLEGQTFELDWVDHGFVIAGRAPRHAAIPRSPAAPRAQSPAMGHRLSEAS
jgi:protein ImuA